MKSILVAEDHPLVLLGIQQSLTDLIPGVTIAKADNFNRVLKALENQKFDMIIMDINMPGGDNVGMLDTVRMKQPGIPILICSSYDEQLYALPYLKAGANGYISKTAPDADFKMAVENVLNAKIYVSASVQQNAFELLFNPNNERPNSIFKLSDKELEIAKLLCKGLTTKSISEIVHLSTPSVSNYKAKIFDKLGVNNVIELSTYFGLNEC